MTSVSLPIPTVGVPLPGRGCDCNSCAFYAGPDGRGGPATVEPLCSGTNSDWLKVDDLRRLIRIHVDPQFTWEAY